VPVAPPATQSLDTLIKQLRGDFPDYIFQSHEDALYWSPQKQTIFYPHATTQLDDKLLAGILHELSHALLGHTRFETDVQLLRLEVAAWDKAKSLGATYAVVIDDEYAQDCIDTYREWLHKRSTCPTCTSHGVQHNKTVYRCLNCQGTWRVSDNRFCRIYRISVK